MLARAALGDGSQGVATLASTVPGLAPHLTALSSARPTVAVVGAGVAGLTAAYLLSRSHDVTLFEAATSIGGHAHTHDVVDSDGCELQVDSGFVVHNDRTYPLLCRLFTELGVVTQPTEMSMSVRCDGCGLEYAGGRGVGGILARPSRLVDARFVRMLTEMPRFYRAAKELLPEREGAMTWGNFLTTWRFSTYFVQHFAVPLVACVWSSGHQDARDYPATFLCRFLDQHGMLGVTGSPQWRTVVGGSRVYVKAAAAQISNVRVSTPVRSVRRHADGVDIGTVDDMVCRYDRVVLATHADTALDLLVDATERENALLSSFRYSVNPTWLHRDTSVLPQARRARAAWNYRLRSCEQSATRVLVSYWMNRLHELVSNDHYLVTLNPDGWVNPEAVIVQTTYHHPIFTLASVTAAYELQSAGGARLAFAGAHLGWGFHEDGCRSGVAAAQRFGVMW